MSKNRINISSKDAKQKLNKQRSKGLVLYKIGYAVAKQNRMKPGTIAIRENDKFESMYKQWIDFTHSELREIYSSSSIAFDFKEKRSSKDDLVSSDWKPDAAYYITKVLLPQLDYLDVLISTLDDYKTSKSSPKSNVSNTEKIKVANHINDYGKMSVFTLLKNISWLSVATFIGFIIGLLIAVAFGFHQIGYDDGLLGNKDLKKMQNTNDSLTINLKTLSTEIDSLKMIIDSTQSINKN